MQYPSWLGYFICIGGLYNTPCIFINFQSQDRERKAGEDFCDRIPPKPTVSSLLAEGLCVNSFQELSLKGSQRLCKKKDPKWLATFHLWPLTQLSHTLKTWNLGRQGLGILFTNTVFISAEQLGKTYPSHLSLSRHSNHRPQTSYS